MVIAFGGAYRFPGFCGNQHIRDPIDELFCWFQVLRHDFMFLSFCIHLHASSFMFLSFACIFLSFCIHFLSCSFHFPFICIHDLSYSFHFHSNVHSLTFIFLSFACMFLFMLHSFPFISFHFLSKVMELALWLGQGTKCNKCLSLSYRYCHR